MLANRYQAVQATTATPERMMMLLFHEALRRIRAGGAALGKDLATATDCFERATAIVLELQRSLNHEAAPELCATLDDVYGFVVGRLALAGTHGDPRFAEEAERALAPVVDG